MKLDDYDFALDDFGTLRLMVTFAPSSYTISWLQTMRALVTPNITYGESFQMTDLLWRKIVDYHQAFPWLLARKGYLWRRLSKAANRLYLSSHK